MRCSVLLFLVCSFSVLAQTTETSKRASYTTSVPIPKEDQSGILKATAGLIRQHVSFRPDGNAAAYFKDQDEHLLVEWKQLQAKQISPAAPEKNSTLRRYTVRFGASAWRAGRSGEAWPAWQSGGFPHFPATITVVRNVDGTFTASAPQLAKFTPGPTANAPASRNSMRSSEMRDGLKNFR